MLINIYDCIKFLILIENNRIYFPISIIVYLCNLCKYDLFLFISSLKKKTNQFLFHFNKIRHWLSSCYLKPPKMVNGGSVSKHSLVLFHHLYAIIQRTMRRKSIIDWAQPVTGGGCIENWVNKLIQDNIRVQSALLLWQANTDFLSPTPHLLFNSHFCVYPTLYVFCVFFGVLFHVLYQ